MSFARKFGDKYGKKLVDTATKTGIDAAKTASKRVVQKPAEATGDLIGNKIDKFTFHQKRGSKLLIMEYQNIKTLLGNISDKVARFITKKWIEGHDQSGEAYNTNRQIRFKVSMLRPYLCDYNDPNIVAKGLVAASAEERDRADMDRDFVLKNNAPFISCISKINCVLIENAEDLDAVMPMYNLLEYNKNYSNIFGSLWNYYRDELTDEANDNNGPNKNIINSKSFK